MATARVEPHQWTREEYERCVESGGLEGCRVELVGGVLYDMTPQTSRHAGLATKISALLQEIDPGDYLIRLHSPLSLDQDSTPEPDIAVVPDDPEGDYYTKAHPNGAVLAVEISDSSLQYDRDIKGPAYARAGIPEYWIVNLVTRQLEVYRKPSADRYGSRTVLTAPDEVSPLFAPGASIPVRRLFPK